MDDPKEHALVVKALVEGTNDCIEWKEQAARRVLAEGYVPSHVKRSMIAFVREAHLKKVVGSGVDQRREERLEWSEHDFWYRVVVFPYLDTKYGMFVEIICTDHDPDVPMVEIVSAHPQPN